MPLPLLGLLAAYRCWRVTRITALDAPTRRFWRHFGYACALITVASVSNAFDALTGDEPTQLLGTLRVLGAGAAVFGGTSPFLIDHPHLSASFTSVAVAAFGVHLAATVQARAGAQPPVQAPSRRISVVPYLAVAASDALLLFTDFRDAGETQLIASCVVCLTVLVAVRQVLALRDNNRLLNTVDANLAQLRRYQDQLSHQATHDPLTGIANRALFEQTMAGLVAARTPFHMALLDLDDFKTVNDRLGHGVGDALIAVLAVGSAVDALRDLRAVGIMIALDDFGTGNSSLSLLVNCPVDVLKVDKSFVSGVTSATSRAVIVDGLVDITNRLRIEAVAEGVETASQAERLYDAGYRYAQGFHYGRPMTVPLVDTWLDEQAAIQAMLQTVDQAVVSTAEMRETSSSVLTGSTITS